MVGKYSILKNGYGYWSVGESGSRGGVGESSGRRGRYRDEIATGETCGDGSSGADINSSEPRIPRMGRPARPKVRVNKLLRQRSARTHPSEPMPLGPSRKRMLEEPLAWQGARQRQRRGTPEAVCRLLSVILASQRQCVTGAAAGETGGGGAAAVAAAGSSERA